MTIPPTRNQLPDDSFEPFEEHTRIPLPVFWIAIALALWGAVMLFHTEQSKTLAVHQRTAALRDLAAFSNEPGADLFAANCMTCHQANGSGVARAIPPLADSPFLKADRSVVVQILLHGINGPIAVEGNTYDGHMPSFASVLGDAEIARLGNFVRHHFAGQQPALDEQFVASQRARFAGRGAWTGGSEIASTLGAQIPGQPAPRATSADMTEPAILALVTQGRGDAWACASCHGGSGQGSGDVPRLAGLPAGYIASQLSQFASGKRRNDTMQVVARNLTPDEMIGIGRYYAGVYAPSTARPALGGDLVRGEKLALEGDWAKQVPACFSCHGASGFGVAPAFPALAAQHPSYIARQLAAWAGGTRDNSPLQMMAGVSKGLSDADRRAVADYLASLPPAPVATPSQKDRKYAQSTSR